MPETVAQFRSIGKLLWESGLVSSHGGNLSVLHRDGAITITRTGCSLARIGRSDLVFLGPDGTIPRGKQPSMDTPFHRSIYEAVIRSGSTAAVVHAHPRHGIALSLRQRSIEPEDLEGQFYLGSVPVVAAEELSDALRTAPVAVVAGHGTYARGGDLWEALKWTSVLEESAEVLCISRMLDR